MGYNNQIDLKSFIWLKPLLEINKWIPRMIALIMRASVDEDFLSLGGLDEDGIALAYIDKVDLEKRSQASGKIDS